MNLEIYPVISDNNKLAYEFLSEGPNGTIKKVVFYHQIGENVFNLAFGDWNEANQVIDDKVRSNNNDRDKVLATVASTVIDFMKYHPDASIFGKGSTTGRTRLYQIGIFKNWYEINERLNVQRFSDSEWQPVQRGRNYQAFIISAK